MKAFHSSHYPTMKGVVVLFAVLLGGSPTMATRFTGFQPAFNLGLSPATNLACAASRTYDDPDEESVRAWEITCKGLGDHRLGEVLVFHGLGRTRALAAWRQRTEQAFDCDSAGGVVLTAMVAGRPGSVLCKARSSGVGYRVLTRARRGETILVAGNKTIEDLLAVAADFVSGRIDEPDSRGLAHYNVSPLTSVDVADILTDSASDTNESEIRRAYQLNYNWDFERAEDRFSALSKENAGEVNATREVESLYNLALNASNNAEPELAQLVFDRAEQKAAAAGLSDKYKGLALNYQSIIYRNDGHFDKARDTALQAIELRSRDAASGPFQRSGGDVRILAGEQDVDNGKLSEADRNALLDVQAYQVAATSMESLGQAASAANLLTSKAMPILARYGDTGAGYRSRPLGEAMPWLNLRIQSDALRLSRSSGKSINLEGFRGALAVFEKSQPNSLPLAASLMELASAEAAEPALQDRALVDYDRAFAIFRDRRGSLGPSADFAAGYFSILLDRIEKGGDTHDADVARFFIAAQTLTSQSSVKAARSASAQRETADPQTALLARQLQLAEADVETQRHALIEAQRSRDNVNVARAESALRLAALDVQSDEAKLQEHDPAYAGLLQSNIELPALQGTLKDGEAYVKAFLLGRQGFGLLITHTAAQPYRISLSRQSGRCLVERFRASMSPKIDPDEDACGITRVRETDGRSLYRFDVDAAAGLFEAIFGPVRGPVLAATSLIYEPDSTLIGAPIAALVVDHASSVKALDANLQALAAPPAMANGQPAPRRRLSYVGVDWLGRHATSAIALDAATFVKLRLAPPSAATAPYLGFANPVIDHDPARYANLGGGKSECEADRRILTGLEPLPDTEVEVKAISARLGGRPDEFYRLGADFNDDAIDKAGVRGDLHKYRVIYFATHGVLEPKDPCLGVALVTSVGNDGGDGLLGLQEIQKLRLDAEMVVLSACNTGITKGGGSEVLGGLVKSFEAANARNLVVSNWSVASKPTARLMADVFSAQGGSQAQALNAAEQKMAQDPYFSHPYFWAPFSIVGDAGRKMPLLSAGGGT